MSTMTCPKGHGPLQRRSVEERIYTDGSTNLIAHWVCPACGYGRSLPATEVDKQAQICDFCSQSNPVKAYDAEDFAYVVFGFNAASVLVSQPCFSRGEWLACALCAAFIDTNDQAGLTARAVQVLVAPVERWDAEQRRVIRDSLDQLHRKFFAHRKGGDADGNSGKTKTRPDVRA